MVMTCWENLDRTQNQGSSDLPLFLRIPTNGETLQNFFFCPKNTQRRKQLLVLSLTKFKSQKLRPKSANTLGQAFVTYLCPLFQSHGEALTKQTLSLAIVHPQNPNGLPWKSTVHLKIIYLSLSSLLKFWARGYYTPWSFPMLWFPSFSH